MTRIPELLVPAGGMEQLKAAVACGADAVYLGGVSFSARAHAANFSEKDLEEAIDYAHTCGVHVHVAMNTLLTEEELPEALFFASKVYGYGADAVIVQDLGLFDRIHQLLPELSLHLSTQGTVFDIHGVRMAAERGASRVILARELSLLEIQEIGRNKDDTEIEIFVHGAICIGMSGQCHLSGTIGGRSGNRGDCAQPCRMRYTLQNTMEGNLCSGYHLSPKDLCLLGHLQEIAEAGVDSVKIEGRMKSPEYVAAVTSIYRKHLDRIKEGNVEANRRDLEADLAVLRQVYSRGSFTDVYFEGRSGQELMSGASPKHQGIYIGKMQSFNRKNGHAVVDLLEPLSVGDGVEIAGRKGNADNVVTYIRSGKSGVLKRAEAGSTAEIGDLRVRNGIPEKGAPVYRLRSRELSQNLKQLSDGVLQRIPVKLHLNAEEGKVLRLEGETSAANQIFQVSAESGEVLECARSGLIDVEKLKERLTRTGGTPYYCSDVDIQIKGSPFVPVSLMNELRRQVLSRLTEKRTTAGRPSKEEAEAAEVRCRNAMDRNTDPGCRSEEGDRIQLYYHESRGLEKRIRELLALWKESDRGGSQTSHLIFCLPLSYFMEQEKQRSSGPSAEVPSVLTDIAEAGFEFDVVLPLELGRTAHQRKAEEILKKLHDVNGFRAVMIANAGQLSMGKDAGCRFETDLTVNVLNQEAASFWIREGACSVCVSEEPDFLSSVSKKSLAPNWCIPLYGRMPVMYLEHCPIGSHPSKLWLRESSGKKSGGAVKHEACCSRQKKQYYCCQSEWSLKDRTGAEFPIRADSDCCRAVIFSHEHRDRTREIQKLRKRGASLFRISIMEESAEKLLQILQRMELR